MITTILVALTVLLGLIVIVLIVGALLPRNHVATKTSYFEAEPNELWRLITDFEAQPAWRSKVQRVEKLPSREGKERWREFEGVHRSLTYETVEAVPPQRLVRRIVDEGLPFGGSWTFEITPRESGSQLTITEHGEIRNVIFRFMSKFVFGHSASLTGYFESLKGALRKQRGVP